MQKDPVTEETVGENHGTDQYVQNREEGNENPYSASQKITPNQHRKVVKIEDQRNFFNEVGSDEGSDKNDADDNFLKMFHNNLFKAFHSLFPLIKKTTVLILDPFTT